MQRSIHQLITRIRELPSDKPEDPAVTGVWYWTQKEHWLGWLGQYHKRGPYGRTPDPRRDARYAYNHIVNHQMLLWLIKAAGLPQSKIRAARAAASRAATLIGKSGAIRRVVPWGQVAETLWRCQ